MNPDISRKAARVLQLIPFEGRAAFIEAVEKAETVSDIPQPYRGWIEGKTKPNAI